MSTSPSPNPITLYRWEEASSLEHACWACPTKANSPKALHTCYGIHSIPCLAYHSTMHAVGASHRCSACTISREMHEYRHKEIAELVVQYHNAEDNILRTPLRKQALLQDIVPVNIPRNDTGLNGRDERDEDEQQEERDEGEEETISIVDESASSTTGTSNSNDSNVTRLTKSEQRAKKRAAKAQKSQDKAARNQARHSINVTSQDVWRVNLILHGGDEEGDHNETSHHHPLATDSTIEEVIARNLGFVKQIDSHKKNLQRTVAMGREEDKDRKRHKRRVSEGVVIDVEIEAVLDAILQKFGINVTTRFDHAAGGYSRKGKSSIITNTTTTIISPSTTITTGSGNNGTTTNKKKQISKSQQILVTKLREAIKSDLEKHENDLRQTYIRAGGFFRYAGRTVFERMTSIAGEIDIGTGEGWEKKIRRMELGRIVVVGEMEVVEEEERDGREGEEIGEGEEEGEENDDEVEIIND